MCANNWFMVNKNIYIEKLNCTRLDGMGDFRPSIQRGRLEIYRTIRPVKIWFFYHEYWYGCAYRYTSLKCGTFGGFPVILKLPRTQFRFRRVVRFVAASKTRLRMRECGYPSLGTATAPWFFLWVYLYLSQPTYYDSNPFSHTGSKKCPIWTDSKLINTKITWSFCIISS